MRDGLAAGLRRMRALLGQTDDVDRKQHRMQKSDWQQFERNAVYKERNITTKRDNPEWNHPAHAECREHES